MESKVVEEMMEKSYEEKEVEKRDSERMIEMDLAVKKRDVQKEMLKDAFGERKME